MECLVQGAPRTALRGSGTRSRRVDESGLYGSIAIKAVLAGYFGIVR